MTFKNSHFSTNDKHQIQQVVDLITKELSTILVGVYLFGSSTQSGLKKNSDLDFLVVTLESISEDTRIYLTNELMTFSRKIGDNSDFRYIELTNVVLKDISPWKHPAYQDFLYGEWLRESFLIGDMSKRDINSDVTIILYQAKSHGLALVGSKEILPVIPFSDVKKAMNEMVAVVVEEVVEDSANVILTLCRILYTLETKEIVSKDLAGNAVKSYFNLTHKRIIELAIKEYVSGESMVVEAQELVELANQLKIEIERRL
ncbi:DUF4111 domain-containing protein [Vagococcus carniphilus]|uniref:aminoglycoside adenylyltransferase domain-containing protein n=1 Tax=Vagococcus carniphilus TaxID=218144 RepID=UPI0028905918|nr:aminoglycoside adenylyltransferase domain-containing protein [Vagococcus carniphilus]MDT2850296.1 DUF4111 domain-containing protein [Vagococcus carniphilus]